MSISTVATSTYVADVAREENLGASLGALSSIMDIGHSSGPFVAGVIITATAIGAGFLASAAVSVLAATRVPLPGFPRAAEEGIDPVEPLTALRGQPARTKKNLDKALFS